MRRNVKTSGTRIWEGSDMERQLHRLRPAIYDGGTTDAAGDGSACGPLPLDRRVKLV
jgi:hypothetical protein